MRALKINFGGGNNVSIDWGGERSGLSAVAQKAGVAVMTQEGSDKFLPTRGTDVMETLFAYGIFDLLSMQHTLNFGALKARSDIQEFESTDDTDALVASIQMALIDVQENAARVGVVVTNQSGQSTREIIEIA